MERYLLFDSGCMRCTELARQIEHATQGWLKARSLRDPTMQTLLNAARPGWRWEPTLVEIADGHVQAFTGLHMRARLAVKLGPRRALRVIQFVQRALSPQENIGQERRSFLKRGAILAGLLIVGPGSGIAQTPREIRSIHKLDSWVRLQGKEASDFVESVLTSTTYRAFIDRIGRDFPRIFIPDIKSATVYPSNRS